MLRRIALTLGVLVLVAVTMASAQVEINGIVGSVDPLTRTIHLTDGRAVQLSPGAVLIADGQPRTLEYVRPGMSLVMVQAPGQATTIITVTRQVQPAPTLLPQPLMVLPEPTYFVASPSAPPVDVTGTIARVEPLTRTFTFADGRVVRLGPQSVVWQQAPPANQLVPGMHVFVRDATPVGFLSSGVAPTPPAGQWMMGTISRVDPASRQIVLTDGTIVHVGPSSTLRTGSEHVAITTLRPGSQIVLFRPATVGQVQATQAGAVTTAVPSGADRYAGSALPYQSYAATRIEATDIYIVWSPQAR